MRIDTFGGRMKKFGLITVMVATILGFGCGSSAESGQPVETSTSTTLPPVPAANPWNELELLAKRFKSLDYSRLSISHDGIFAVVLKNKRNFGLWDVGTVTLWQWDGRVWTDVTATISNVPDSSDPSMMEDKSSTGGRFVTTYDYTKDGVNDFLVSFDESAMGYNHPVGGILALIDGKWSWQEFMSYDGTLTTLMQELNYSTDRQIITARDYMRQEFPFYDENDFYWDSDHSFFRGTGGAVYGD